MSKIISMTQMGWQSFFQQQMTLEEWELMIPARIIEQHKSYFELFYQQGTCRLPVKSNLPPLVVGDWILINQNFQFVRLLERKSCFYRKAAGTQVATQLISSNVDTAFIVCSMNEDFNLNRIERFLTLVNESGAMPVIVLTKVDCCEDPDAIVAQVSALSTSLCIESVNCLDSSSVQKLNAWIQTGSTLAVIGSSGVGKSTLINTLSQQNEQQTGEIRVNDSKGKHTTTRRSLVPLGDSAVILDTPGMREIQLADCKAGISKTFSDIEKLAEQCRFSDCQHQSEPGCSVLQAIQTNKLEPRRLKSYLKLKREEQLNSSNLAEKRAKDKSLTRMYKSIQSKKHQQKF